MSLGEFPLSVYLLALEGRSVAEIAARLNADVESVERALREAEQPASELPAPFRRMFDMADAMGRTRSEYLGLARQDALDAALDRGFETRVLDLPATGLVAWRGDLQSDRLNLVVQDGTVIRAALF